MQVAWQMLGLQHLNTELQSAVGAAELEALALADKGSFTNDNAAALLPPCEMDFGSVGVGLEARLFWVSFTNNSALPVCWELHSYDKPQVRQASVPLIGTCRAHTSAHYPSMSE